MSRVVSVSPAAVSAILYLANYIKWTAPRIWMRPPRQRQSAKYVILDRSAATDSHRGTALPTACSPKAFCTSTTKTASVLTWRTHRPLPRLSRCIMPECSEAHFLSFDMWRLHVLSLPIYVTCNVHHHALYRVIRVSQFVSEGCTVSML